MTDKDAHSLKRSTRKFTKADEDLRSAGKGDDICALADNYLRARKAHQRVIEKVESA